MSQNLMCRPVALLHNPIRWNFCVCAAGLVFSARRSEHTTPLVRELDWLKVQDRIQFRLWVQTLHCLHSTAPPYLAEMQRRHWSYRWHVDLPSTIARLWWLRFARGILCRHLWWISCRSLRFARSGSWHCLATPLPTECSIWWTVSQSG